MATLVVEMAMAGVVPAEFRVDLPLILVLYIGWRSNPVRGAVSGSLFGLLQDVLLGIYLGLNGLSKTIVGFSAAYLSHWVQLDAGITRPFVISFFFLSDSGIFWVLLTLIGDPPIKQSWMGALIQAGITAVVGEVIFRLLDRIKFPPKDFRREY